MKFLNVLCIDGVDGTGKTTQVAVFRNFLNSHQIPNKIIKLKETKDGQITHQKLMEISNYLNSVNDGVVICDGSIASDIVYDFASNTHQDKLYNKHKDNLQIYEDLNNKFNFVNILLSPINIEMCVDRLKKKKTDESNEIKDLQHMSSINDGLKNFDNHMLTYNIKFHNVDLFGHESILDIHEQILNIINQNYTIKKPE